MTNKINYLFKFAYKAGIEVQKREHSGEEIDGKRVWQEIDAPVSNIIITEMI
jgi:hypothetical protein